MPYLQVGFRPLASGEFAGACSVLADQGLLGLGHHKEERLRRITMRVSEEDLVLALQDVRALRACLLD